MPICNKPVSYLDQSGRRQESECVLPHGHRGSHVLTVPKQGHVGPAKLKLADEITIDPCQELARRALSLVESKKNVVQFMMELHNLVLELEHKGDEAVEIINRSGSRMTPSEWVAGHPIMILLTNRLRNMCNNDPDWSYERSKAMVARIARL